MPELSYHQPNQRFQHQIMLRLILNRLKAKAEELLTETVYLIKRHNKNFFFLFCTWMWVVWVFALLVVLVLVFYLFVFFAVYVQNWSRRGCHVYGALWYLWFVLDSLSLPHPLGVCASEDTAQACTTCIALSWTFKVLYKSSIIIITMLTSLVEGFNGQSSYVHFRRTITSIVLYSSRKLPLKSSSSY